MAELIQGPLIAVAANEHPERDGWVDEHAALAAAEGNLTLGRYLGREDVLPGDQELCCHLYATTECDDGSGT